MRGLNIQKLRKKILVASGSLLFRSGFLSVAYTIYTLYYTVTI